MLRSRFAILGAALAATTLLGGCGAAKDAINSNISPIDNPLRLNSQGIVAVISRAVQVPSRAAIPALGTVDATFNDGNSISRASDLTFARIDQALSRTVTVAVPVGATLPESFTISGVVLNVTLADGTGTGETGTGFRRLNVRGLTSDGPFTFNKTGDNTYTLSSNTDIGLSQVQIGRDDTQSLINIISSQNNGSNENAVHADFGFTADDTQLPEGSTVTFTFINGSARVGI